VELTWVAIAASVVMGLAAACMFVFAIKKNYFHNLEDAKYQVFWSDLEELVDRSEEKKNVGGPQKP
jgi:hypothetical protein